MNERKELTWGDWTGIGMFAVGAFGAVLMLFAMSRSTPLAQSGGTAAIAATWAHAIGMFPSIFWNAAIALLGAKLFLQSDSRGLIRNLLGVTGLALALAVFLGAFTTSAGGIIGEHTGAVVTQATHFMFGGLLGLAVVFAVLWFTWLRESSAVKSGAIERTTVPNPGSNVATEPVQAARNQRPALAKSAAANEGVTAAESAALFPEEELVLDEPGVRKILPPNVTKAPIPPSPYPEDVRLKGKIPPGAKPLETMRSSASDVQAPNVQRWVAPRAPQPASEAIGTDPTATDLAPFDSDLEEMAAEPIADEKSAKSAESAELTVAEPLAPVPVPSWEQPALFAPEVEDEPVDAYGTPLSLVEKLRRARRVGGLEPAPVREDDAPSIETAEAMTEDKDEELQAAVAALDSEDEQRSAVIVVATDDEDDLDGEPEFDDADDDEFDDDEFDDDEEDDDDDESVDEDDETDAEDEGYEIEEVAVAVTASAVVENLQPAKSPEISRPSAVNSADAATALERADAKAPSTTSETVPTVETKIAAAASVAQPSLFDAVQPNTLGVTGSPVVSSSSASTPSKPTAVPPAPRTNMPSAIPAEREVVLQPQAAVPPERAEKRPASLEGRQKLLAEVGCLFVERGRVAVSMLQRQYSMDFDDACKVLDELQELGLIGPYLGGQRRDILLTREQWMEKVASP